MKRKIFTYIICMFLIAIDCLGQNTNYLNKNSIGIEFGAWNPNNLQSSESKTSLSSIEKNIFYGGFLLTPLTKSLLFRITIGYYNFSKNNSNKINDNLTLLPLLFDIKYLLIPETRISPYVSYGIGSCLFYSSNEDVSSIPIKNRIGYSLNLGTGFDFLLTKHLAFSFEFRYHYLKFNKEIIFTDNYSGSKINLTFYYLL